MHGTHDKPGTRPRPSHSLFGSCTPTAPGYTCPLDTGTCPMDILCPLGTITQHLHTFY